MNKKFSTLMALALVGGSVSAQNWADLSGSTVQGAYRTFATKAASTNPTANPALALNGTALTTSTGTAWTKDVKSIDGSLWYQLEVNDTNTDYPDVLIQERDCETGKIFLRVVEKSKAPLNASLWQIQYFEADGVSGGYFTYINKETGLALTLDHSVVPAANNAITELRAGTAEWSWYTVGATNSNPFTFEKVYSYLHNQKNGQVMYLAYAADGDAYGTGTVANLLTKLNTKGLKFATTDGRLVKAKVVNTATAGDKLQNLNDVLAIKPVVAAPFFMSAQEFNTRMDADMKTNDKNFMFKMNKQLQGAGSFTETFTATENALSLTDANLTTIQTLNENGSGFTSSTVSLEPLKNKFNLNFKVAGTYLLADTARYQQAAYAPSVSPAVTFNLSTPQASDNDFMKARYYFRATYYPTNDSLVLEPLNAAVQADYEWSAKTPWKSSKATTSFARTQDYSKANSLVNDYNAGNGFNGSKTVSLTAATIPGVVEEVLTVAKDNLNEFKVKLTIDRPFEYLNRATKKTGLYYINLANHADRQRATGMSIVKNMTGNMMYDTQAMNQRYDLMPATMWTVQQLGCTEMGLADSAKYVRIQNREYPGVVFEGQLYSTDGVTYRFIDRSATYTGGYASSTGMFVQNFLQVADLITFTEVTDPIAKTSTHGYKMFSKDELNNGIENNYNIKWNNFLNDNLYLQSAKDKNSYIAEATSPVFYEIAEATWSTDKGVIENSFGSTDANMNLLNRKAYIVKVKDNNLIDNNQLYIASVKSSDGRYYYKAVKKSELNNVDKKLAYFYFKADQVRLDDKGAIMDACYVLVDIAEPATAMGQNVTLHPDNGWMKVAVEAGYEMGVLRDNNLNDEPNDVSDAFYTTHEVRPQYVNIAKDYDVTLNSNIKIYQQLAAKNYLFEDCKDHNNVQLIQNINPKFHYLGVESRTMDVEKDAALYVDEVVNDYALMPRYLFGVRVDSIPDGYVCSDASRIHGYWDTKAAAEGDGEVHFEAYNGYTAGWFLVNLEDSIGSSTNMMDDADLYKFNNYTRLGFVQGIHQVMDGKETLYILQNGYTLNDLMTIKDNGKHAQYTKAGFVLDPAKLTAQYVKAHDIAGNINTNQTFSLRKTNTYADDAYNKTASEPFLLESNCPAVASFKGNWVKTENGVPVLAKLNTESGEHEGNGSVIAEQIGQSGIFYFGATTDKATSNDNVSVSSVTVIAKEGAVEIAGAAGKKVVISNILGQTISNTTVTSDLLKVSVPAGVVVVAVEGEAAVKAIVK